MGGGSVDPFECIAPSWSSGATAASALVGTLDVTQMLGWRADYEEIERSLNGRLGW